MSFQEERDDETEVEVDENSRPSFFDITKDANALDRELEASGFTKKEQNDLDKVCDPFYLSNNTAYLSGAVCTYETRILNDRLPNVSVVL